MKKYLATALALGALAVAGVGVQSASAAPIRGLTVYGFTDGVSIGATVYTPASARYCEANYRVAIFRLPGLKYVTFTGRKVVDTCAEPSGNGWSSGYASTWIPVHLRPGRYVAVMGASHVGPYGSVRHFSGHRFTVSVGSGGD
jgi:hypothetical protein